MNLDELRSVQNRERATDSLQELRDSFYGDVAAYVEGLREERDGRAAAADDPFGDPDVSRLTDEIEMAEQVAEAIYERRVGKIVKQASLAAAGMPGDTEGLTDEERELYGDLVDLIEANKSHVLDVLAGGDADAGATVESATKGAADGPAADASQTSGGVDASAAMGGADDARDTPVDSDDETTANEAAMAEAVVGAGGDAADPDAAADADADDPAGDRDDGPAVSRETVRITRDVGEIFGVDEQVYHLEAEDVVQLPEENAEPLVEREAAEKLE